MLSGALLFALAATPVAAPVPLPDWFVERPLPVANATEGGSLHLLRESQFRVGKRVEVVHREAWKVLNHSGVESLGSHSFAWDPAFQSLQLHRVWIWRDGVKRDAFSPEDARVLQRETGLERGTYDGRLSLALELRDLRAGDTLELAWSVAGTNPVFGSHAFVYLDQFAHETIAAARWRLLWERPEAPVMLAHGEAVLPSSKKVATGHELTWESKLTRFPWEDDVPADEDPTPWVELTDWKDWGEVARWATALFDVPLTTPRLQEQLRAFEKMPEGEPRARAAVEWVQDTIRYTGVELGESAIRPHTPDWVLERRFGDCKDKSLLLVGLLRRLGFRAWPALVSSRRGIDLHRNTPAPQQFDHAIVALELEGKRYFIDATAQHERGSLISRAPPAFHRALVLDGRSTALEAIDAAPPEASEIHYTQHWTHREGQLTQLRLTTVARGVEAVLLRDFLSTHGRDEAQRAVAKRRVEHLEVQLSPKGFEVTDDGEKNLLTIVEDYEALTLPLEDGRQRLEPILVTRRLPEMPAGPRVRSLRFAHPRRVRETILLDASTAFLHAQLDTPDTKVDVPAFAFRVERNIRANESGLGRRLELDYRYESLTDRVKAADLPATRTAVAKIWSEMAYVLRVPTATAVAVAAREREESSWWGLSCLLFLVVFALGGLYWVARPESEPGPSWRARWKLRAFKKLQRSSAGEAADTAVALLRVEQAERLFPRKCKNRHPLVTNARVVDSVQFGGELLTIVERSCTRCEAPVRRYVKLLQ